MSSRFPNTKHSDLQGMILSKLYIASEEGRGPIDLIELGVSVARELYYGKSEKFSFISRTTSPLDIPQNLYDDLLEILDSSARVRHYLAFFYENLDDLRDERLLRMMNVSETEQKYPGQRYLNITNLGKRHVEGLQE